MSTFEAAEAIKVLPKLHRGKPEICKLERTEVRLPLLSLVPEHCKP